MTENTTGAILCSNILGDEVITPKGGGNDYLKLENGKNRVRILQGVVQKYKSFPKETDTEERKKKGVITYELNDSFAKRDPNSRIHTFFLVYDYADECIKIWEIASVAVFQDLKNLAELKGDLSGYDLQITKSGSGMKITYSIADYPAKPFINKDVIDQVIERPLLERMKAKESEAVIDDGMNDDKYFNTTADDLPA